MASAWGAPNPQAQYNQLFTQMNQILQQGGMADNPTYLALRAQRDQLAGQSGGQSAPASSGGVGTAQSNWANALKNTEGRGDQVMSDPYTQAALSRFQNVLSGADEPYTQQVQSQLLARQADAGAASAASQGQMLRDSQAALGGSMADPQAQAAMRQIMAANQQQNNANLGDMNTRATLSNFGAKNDAASNLAATRGGQLGMANSQYNQASTLYANQNLAGQHVNAAGNYAPPIANYNQQPNGNQAPAGQPSATNRPVNAAGGYGSTQYGPPSPGSGLYTQGTSTVPGQWKPVISNSSYGQSYGRPATPAYDANGTNTTTGTGYGSGYVQQAGQPNTRVQYGLGQYQPNLPVY